MQFNPTVPINSNTLGYRKNPTIDDAIHCILFVIDSLSLEVFPEKILKKIKDIRQKANDLGSFLFSMSSQLSDSPA